MNILATMCSLLQVVTPWGKTRDWFHKQFFCAHRKRRFFQCVWHLENGAHIKTWNWVFQLMEKFIGSFDADFMIVLTKLCEINPDWFVTIMQKKTCHAEKELLETTFKSFFVDKTLMLFSIGEVTHSIFTLSCTFAHFLTYLIKSLRQFNNF